MDGFFWKVGAMPSICMVALSLVATDDVVSFVAVLLLLLDDGRLDDDGVSSGEPVVIEAAAELRDSHDDITDSRLATFFILFFVLYLLVD